MKAAVSCGFSCTLTAGSMLWTCHQKRGSIVNIFNAINWSSRNKMSTTNYVPLVRLSMFPCNGGYPCVQSTSIYWYSKQSSADSFRFFCRASDNTTTFGHCYLKCFLNSKIFCAKHTCLQLSSRRM